MVQFKELSKKIIKVHQKVGGGVAFLLFTFYLNSSMERWRVYFPSDLGK